MPARGCSDHCRPEDDDGPFMREENHCFDCHEVGIGHPPDDPDTPMIMPPCEGCEDDRCDECHEIKDVRSVYARCLFHSLLLHLHELPCNTAHDFALSFGCYDTYGRLFDRALDFFLDSYKDAPFGHTIPDIRCSENDFITLIKPLDIDEAKLMEILTNTTSVLFQKLLKSYRFGMANDHRPVAYAAISYYYLTVINRPSINDFLP